MRQGRGKKVITLVRSIFGKMKMKLTAPKFFCEKKMSNKNSKLFEKFKSIWTEGRFLSFKVNIGPK